MCYPSPKQQRKDQSQSKKTTGLKESPQQLLLQTKKVESLSHHNKGSELTIQGKEKLLKLRLLKQSISNSIKEQASALDEACPYIKLLPQEKQLAIYKSLVSQSNPFREQSLSEFNSSLEKCIKQTKLSSEYGKLYSWWVKIVHCWNVKKISCLYSCKDFSSSLAGFLGLFQSCRIPTLICSGYVLTYCLCQNSNKYLSDCDCCLCHFINCICCCDKNEEDVHFDLEQ